MSHVHDLPREVNVHTFEYLSWPDIAAAAQVCKPWRDLAREFQSPPRWVTTVHNLCPPEPPPDPDLTPLESQADEDNAPEMDHAMGPEEINPGEGLPAPTGRIWGGSSLAGLTDRLYRMRVGGQHTNSNAGTRQEHEVPIYQYGPLIKQLFDEMRMAGRPDLCMVFASEQWAAHLDGLHATLRTFLPSCTHLIGCSSVGVVGTGADGGTLEEEDGPSLSISLLHMPNTKISCFWQPQMLVNEETPAMSGQIVDLAHEDERPAIIVMGDDPRTMEMTIQHLSKDHAGAKVIGGLCPAIKQVEGVARGVSMILSAPDSLLPLRGNSGVWGYGYQQGLVGVTLQGGILMEPAVSRGVKMLGDVYQLDKLKVEEHSVCPGQIRTSNWIQGLSRSNADATKSVGSKVPLQVMQELQEQYSVIPQPLYVGVKDASAQPGPHGYHMLNPRNLDPVNGALCVDGDVKEGDLVAFHYLDSAHSEEELSASGDRIQQLIQMPANPRESVALGAVAFQCCGRGEQFHGKYGADTQSLLHGLKMGTLPVAGIFATGEVGPSPEWEDGGDEALKTKRQGFTSVFGVIQILPV